MDMGITSLPSSSVRNTLLALPLLCLRFGTAHSSTVPDRPYFLAGEMQASYQLASPSNNSLRLIIACSSLTTFDSYQSFSSGAILKVCAFLLEPSLRSVPFRSAPLRFVSFKISVICTYDFPNLIPRTVLSKRHA